MSRQLVLILVVADVELVAGGQGEEGLHLLNLGKVRTGVRRKSIKILPKTKNDSCNGVDCSGIKTMYFETLSQMLTATVLIARKTKLSSIVNWPK